MRKMGFKTLYSIVVLLFISTAISACNSRPISESSIHLNASVSEELVFGAGSFGFTYSVSEYGLFYHKNNKLQYYDLEAKESYVLCSKANCSHSDASCGAWYKNMDDATGLAMYGENVYVIKLNPDSNTYDLLSMDPTGSNQKVIYSLDVGEYKPGSWVANDIGDVYYAGGMAWFSAQYQYIGEVTEESNEFDYFESTIALGVNLQDVTTIMLNELPEDKVMYESEDNARYEFELVSKNYIMVSKNWNGIEQLSQKDFYEAYEQGEFEEFGNATDPQYEYFMWYQDHREPMFSYLLYDVKTGEWKEFDSGKYELNFDDDGHVGGVYSKYIFSGIYDGKLIYKIPDYEQEDVSVYLLDVKTNEREQILDIKNGGTLGTGYSGIFDDEKILYCLFTENEKADIFYYNIRTKEHVELFQDDRRITFRMIGETADKYIGIIYSPVSYNPTVYMIDKEDYYNGDLKAAEKLF
ncbi:hypothetical protein GC105_01785 [Alkalibaculum sp. M08DMB]|uniref:DUF5050 domain-containing protein n=1 Tax=Alkalibaculum sporogenes TaxID=2655001 RepID=A0A6A7K5V4_9FIRM|nr:hypothetical protein [Alkalibaculum sporogenes]MPW24523.1 hypothetical protein [Alkalibaculum sporogenes]